MRDCYDAERLEYEINNNHKQGRTLVSVVPHPEIDKAFLLVYKEEY